MLRNTISLERYKKNKNKNKNKTKKTSEIPIFGTFFSENFNFGLYFAEN